MSIQSEIDRINENVQSTLGIIADTGVEVGSNSDALPAAATALAKEKAPINHVHSYSDIQGSPIVVTVDGSWNTSHSANEIATAKNNGEIVILNCGPILAEVTASGPGNEVDYVDFSTVLCADTQLMKLTIRVTGNSAVPSFSNITADSIGLTPFSGAYDDLTDVPASFTPASHSQAASTVTAGTFAGQVVANSSGQAPGTSLIRNIKLVAEEATPTVNGEIFFVYG